MRVRVPLRVQNGRVAQGIEQLTSNESVARSIRAAITNRSGGVMVAALVSNTSDVSRVGSSPTLSTEVL